MKIILSAFFLFSLAGCAHGYYFEPEVTGDGAMHGKGGVLYSIPPASPVVRMKLVSLGIVAPDAKKPQLPKQASFQVRMYFLRSKEVTSTLKIQVRRW